MDIFAKRFKALLESRNLSQIEFARKFGFPQKTVNSWCLGICYPKVDTLIFICKELDESSDYLLGLKDE